MNLACSHKCGTCSMDRDSCLTCSHSSREGPNCNCKSGFREVGYHPECVGNKDLYIINQIIKKIIII